MSWSPEDDEPEFPSRRLSRGMCDCDMCNEDPAEESDLTSEDLG